MNQYELDDAVARHRSHPKTFAIPSQGERAGLAVGDHAKLIFLEPEGGGERMWVEVTRRLASGEYLGQLRNEPGGIPGLKWGASVRFEPKHVIDVQHAGSVEYADVAPVGAVHENCHATGEAT